MKILGLTGNIACGKSTLAMLLKERGAVILDADKLVHELYADLEFSRQVDGLFQDQEILTPLGIVDRARLGPVVFSDESAMSRLEDLVHPAVADLRDAKLQALSTQEMPPAVVILEAVKLIESGQAEKCQEVWCIVSSFENQLQRLMETRGLSEIQARARLDAQPALSQKKSLLAALGIPLVLIQNDGSLEDFQQNVENHWNEFLQKGNLSAFHSPNEASQNQAFPIESPLVS